MFDRLSERSDAVTNGAKFQPVNLVQTQKFFLGHARPSYPATLNVMLPDGLNGIISVVIWANCNLKEFPMFLRALIILAALAVPFTDMGQAQAQNKAARNLTAGQAFLAANKQKSDVKVLPSGLQYTVVRAGTGKRPKASDRVVVHYRGSSIGGKEFDSSYSRGQPATFPVNRVIPGWTEALQIMRTGAKWRIAIPPDLAYGRRGAGGAIGPNETLLFDIELLEIK